MDKERHIHYEATHYDNHLRLPALCCSTSNYPYTLFYLELLHRETLSHEKMAGVKVTLHICMVCSLPHYLDAIMTSQSQIANYHIVPSIPEQDSR